MTGRQIAATALVALLAAAGYYYWTGGTWRPPASGTQLAQKAGGRGPVSGGGRFRNANIEGPIPVLATTARRADVPVYLDGVGTAKALNTVTVRPQVDGRLIEIDFGEGQDVEKGDVLARIDPTTYQALLDQAVGKKAQDEALLANARLDLERFARLAASNAATKQQADTARATVNQLEAAVKIDQATVDNARAVLGYTTVTAPISGRTGLRLVDVGNIVHASDATGLVVITQIKPISVLFSLPQQQLQDVNRGMAANGTLPVDAIASDSGKVLDHGKLVVVDNQVDQTTGTVRLKAEFPNAGLQLWPGQFVNVRLLIDTLKQVVVVPTAAVQRGPDGTFVYVVGRDDTVGVRQVTASHQNDVRSVVDAGLQGGEQVVTSGFSRLAAGTHVQVTPAGEDGTAAAEPSARPAGAAAPAGPPRDRRRPQKTGAVAPGATVGIGGTGGGAGDDNGGGNPRAAP